ncbi:hypothetical protein AVEN_266277-1 [Araneus ventricosus]|uniref:Uncharacterized protein n=1 Tax=Araneus ventricosus TaxID=182803 RepID=A0A4Y2UJZ2_ARAVE|nr:hypothetical protein AVEN_266277-1 [Araneus ventricosus]
MKELFAVQQPILPDGTPIDYWPSTDVDLRQQKKFQFGKRNEGRCRDCDLETRALTMMMPQQVDRPGINGAGIFCYKQLTTISVGR